MLTALEEARDMKSIFAGLRRRLRKWIMGSVPLMGAGANLGSPEYQKHRKAFMPIEIQLGGDTVGDDLFAVYCWEPGQEVNGFMTVTGGSGSGKTEALKLLGRDLVRHGIPIVTIDFHGDVIFEGQNTVLLHPNSRWENGQGPGINPLATSPHGWLGMENKIRRETERILTGAGPITPRQSSALRSLLRDLYEDFGIDDAHPDFYQRLQPTYLDLHRLILDRIADDDYRGDRTVLYGCEAKVEALATNAVFQKSSGLTVEEMCDYTLRLDCSLLDGRARLVVAETVLQMIFEAFKAKGPIPTQPQSDADRFRVFVMIDEAKIMTQGRGDPNKADLIVNIMATQARKFGVGIIMASQMWEHFSDEVHNCFATRIVMKGMDAREAKKVAPRMSLRPEELIEPAPAGSGYFYSGYYGGTVRLRLDQA